MLEQKTLDQLWNFDDPAGSEARFRAAAEDGNYDADNRRSSPPSWGGPSDCRAATRKPTPCWIPSMPMSPPWASGYCWNAGAC